MSAVSNAQGLILTVGLVMDMKVNSQGVTLQLLHCNVFLL